MKRIFLVTSLVLISLTSIKAQQFKFGFQTGISTYSFNELKKLNSNLQTTNSFETKIVSNYPPYFYYQPSFSIVKSTYSVGVYYNFKSSGSRISAKDFSGEYSFDTRINASSLGFTGEKFLFKVKGIQLGLYSNVGFSFTKLNIKEYLVLGDSTFLNTPNNLFKGYNSFFEPGFVANLPKRNYGLELNIGYTFQFFGSKLSSSKEKDYKLFDPLTHKTVKAQWTGLIVGITFYYLFSEGMK